MRDKNIWLVSKVSSTLHERISTDHVIFIDSSAGSESQSGMLYQGFQWTGKGALSPSRAIHSRSLYSGNRMPSHLAYSTSSATSIHKLRHTHSTQRNNPSIYLSSFPHTHTHIYPTVGSHLLLRKTTFFVMILPIFYPWRRRCMPTFLSIREQNLYIFFYFEIIDRSPFL